MTAQIELQNLTKDYGRFRALDDVSLTIGEGITGLLGPNGAGKSTLIKVLLGLVSTTQGTGTVLGHSISSEATAIRSKVGYMPEDDCYMHGLSGIECVQVAAQLSRLPATEALRRGHEILDFCGMGQERYRNVETYSTGMRQKLRFAMAIVHDPQLLILDEPTSGLDPEERESMLNRIRILSRQFQKTIILCTHILPDVQVVCDHVLVLAAGRVRLSERLSVLCESPDASLTIQVHGDIDLLNSGLQQAGLRTELLSERQLKVFGAAESISPVLWKTAAESEISVRTITPSKNSLEQVFLKAVREVTHANS
jgi:ABC-2 type transport system ATP-binding protein